MSEKYASSSAPSTAPLTDEVYSQLQHKLEAAVRAVLPKWMADRQDDLVQVALMRLIELRRKSEKTKQFSSSYLWRMAYSILIDEIRRIRRRRETSLEDETGAETFESQSPTPQRIVEARELDRALRDCLGRMVRPRRLAVTLHLQGFRVAESAPILGWEAKRVYNLVHRGLKDLRQCLTEKGLEP